MASAEDPQPFGAFAGPPAGALDRFARPFARFLRIEAIGGALLLIGGGMLAGIGFTMPLFIADLALADDLIGTAKLSVLLASTASAVAGLSLLVGSSHKG